MIKNKSISSINLVCSVLLMALGSMEVYAVRSPVQEGATSADEQCKLVKGNTEPYIFCKLSHPDVKHCPQGMPQVKAEEKKMSREELKNLGGQGEGSFGKVCFGDAFELAARDILTCQKYKWVPRCGSTCQIYNNDKGRCEGRVDNSCPDPCKDLNQ